LWKYVSELVLIKLSLGVLGERWEYGIKMDISETGNEDEG
jgi:hypothetical protein